MVQSFCSPPETAEQVRRDLSFGVIFFFWFVSFHSMFKSFLLSYVVMETEYYVDFTK